MEQPTNNQTACYALSNEQNQIVAILEQRLASAVRGLQEAEQEMAGWQALHDARLQVLGVKRQTVQAEKDHRNIFLAYIVREFELPATKNDSGWEPRQTSEGKFALFAEPAEEPPAPGPLPEPAPSPVDEKKE